MKMSSETKNISSLDVKEDFSWGAAIAVMVLLLAFIGASFYVLVSSYMDIS